MRASAAHPPPCPLSPLPYSLHVVMCTCNDALIFALARALPLSSSCCPSVCAWFRSSIHAGVCHVCSVRCGAISVLYSHGERQGWLPCRRILLEGTFVHTRFAAHVCGSTRIQAEASVKSLVCFLLPISEGVLYDLVYLLMHRKNTHLKTTTLRAFSRSLSTSARAMANFSSHSVRIANVTRASV